jgi:hypothetical protein
MSLGGHWQCPESRRSNSWDYGKQHRFRPYGWVDCGASPTKYEKQGGKAMPFSRNIAVNGIGLLVLGQAPNQQQRLIISGVDAALVDLLKR